MKQIVVTTDLSSEAHVAFKVAEKFARAFKAKVTLLTVVEDPQQAAMVYAMEFPVFADSNIHKELVTRIESELKKLAATEFQGLETEYVVREASGPVHKEILDFATERKADLVILATHGRTGVKHLLIGSVAERVAREAHSPVLIVPTRTMMQS